MSYGVGKSRRQGKADHWADLEGCLARAGWRLGTYCKALGIRHDQAVSLKDGQTWQSDEELGQANLAYPAGE